MGIISYVALDAKLNHTNIEQIIDKTLQLGFNYTFYSPRENSKYNLPRAEILQIIYKFNENINGNGEILFGSFNHNGQTYHATFDISQNNKYLSVSLDPDGGEAWKKNFISNTESIDIAVSIRILLEITENFLIKRINSCSLDFDYLYLHDPTAVKKYEKNRIYGKINGSYYELGVAIRQNAKNHQYIFYDSNNIEKRLNDINIEQLLDEAFNKKITVKFFIKHEDIYSEIEIHERWIISLKPLKHFRIKETEDAKGMDLAFYTEIFLNLIEGIAIYEIDSTFPIYE